MTNKCDNCGKELELKNVLTIIFDEKGHQFCSPECQRNHDKFFRYLHPTSFMKI
ncbi:MAG: hypothetical protein LBM02_08110 [Lachnospiraceae bacterium]|jgi:hypothetical protein|nr:hypothetical protein [Lachnospiraceae bacterium]